MSHQVAVCGFADSDFGILYPQSRKRRNPAAWNLIRIEIEAGAHDKIARQHENIHDIMDGVPSGKLTVRYWTWSFLVDFPIKHCHFQ